MSFVPSCYLLELQEQGERGTEKNIPVEKDD